MKSNGFEAERRVVSSVLSSPSRFTGDKGPQSRAILEALFERYCSGERSLTERDVAIQFYRHIDDPESSTPRKAIARLRRILEDVFENEGSYHTLRVRIPKKEYRLEFFQTGPTPKKTSIHWFWEPHLSGQRKTYVRKLRPSPKISLLSWIGVARFGHQVGEVDLVYGIEEDQDGRELFNFGGKVADGFYVGRVKHAIEPKQLSDSHLVYLSGPHFSEAYQSPEMWQLSPCPPFQEDGVVTRAMRRSLGLPYRFVSTINGQGVILELDRQCKSRCQNIVRIAEDNETHAHSLVSRFRLDEGNESSPRIVTILQAADSDALEALISFCVYKLPLEWAWDQPGFNRRQLPLEFQVAFRHQEQPGGECKFGHCTSIVALSTSRERTDRE